MYDLRLNSSDTSFPSEIYLDFLAQADIQKKIGAEVQYVECSREVSRHFGATGDVRFCIVIFKDSIQSELTKT